MARNCMGPMIVAMSPELGYTAVDKGLILGAFSAGYMLTQMPGGILADRFGAKPVLSLAIVSVSLCLLVLPCAAGMSLHCLLWLLWAAGFMCGPVFPAMQAMSSKWTYGGLKSYASSVCGAGTTAGSLLALGLTSPLATVIGWRMTSVVLGCTCLSFGVLWLLKAQDSPDGAPSALSAQDSPTVSSNSTWPQLFRCWAKILLAPPVLSIFLVHCSQVVVRTFLASWMPTYYDEVLRVSSEAAAVYLVIPEILGMASSLLAGRAARSLEQSGLSTLSCRRLFLGLGTSGMALGLLAVPWMDGANAVTVVLCFTQVFSNLHQAGFTANYLDVCKYSNGLVSGVGNSVASLGSYVGPIFTSSMLASSSADRQGGWKLVLSTFASINFAALVVYLPLASDRPVDLMAGKVAGEGKLE
eukprot:CAMPEP_0179030622 /NCGR_PEP_ID=MMETSP0796-20121207/10657_1 /TAXON_ID=73915 /ORGANISM="Pyrodinium bahamense, Strain pbaha01" /LENGTH=412 /DNA_ID=CAMNT_0020726803 /DNA_START=71 /DNA_END=1309 /DNA_ORIENTATION=-